MDEVETGGAKVALLIGCSGYDDPGFQELTAPVRDLDGLTRVLVDSAIGDFTVDRKLDDLLLLYFSCHGVLDAKRRLYFVAVNTKKDRVGSTGISAQWVKQQMDQSRSQCIVLEFTDSGEPRLAILCAQGSTWCSAALPELQLGSTRYLNPCVRARYPVRAR